MLTVERDGQALEMQLTGVPYDEWLAEYTAASNAIVPCRRLEGDIGYIHMGALKNDQIVAAMSLLQDTQAIIFDVRSYPQGTIWGINDYLNESARPWARLFYPLPQAPGYFGNFLMATGPAKPNPDHYQGRIVILANENTRSQAEFTCMALQATGRSTLIGSQTSGADGNVSILFLPGRNSPPISPAWEFFTRTAGPRSASALSPTSNAGRPSPASAPAATKCWKGRCASLPTATERMS